MALIKCNECKKEISDKAENCIHCGCPVEIQLFCSECGKKVEKDDTLCKNCGCPVEKQKEKIKIGDILSKLWIVLCIITCLIISGINFFNVFNIDGFSITFSVISINAMGILVLLLAISYGWLLKSFSKKSFYFMLCVNAIILFFNILYLQMVTNLFYIICVFLNSIITFFVIRKNLKKDKFSFKKFVPSFLVLIVTIIITCLFVVLDYNQKYKEQSNERNTSIAQLEIVTDYINIRSSKSVNSTILGEVSYGEIYTIISDDENSRYHWYEIETSSGIRGYIAGKSGDNEYIRLLDVAGSESDEEEKVNDIKTTTKKVNKVTTKKKTNNTNKNDSTTTNVTTQKTCNESAKQQLTNEYQTILQQREAEFQTNMEKTKQQVAIVQETMNTTGYLSKDEYETLYSQAVSEVEKKMLKTRYDLSRNYDKIMNTYNQLEPKFNEWKNAHKAWYEDELRKLGC